MSCYDFEIATDTRPSRYEPFNGVEFAWRPDLVADMYDATDRISERYMLDEPDYADFDLYLPPSTAHVEERPETYRLGRHTRTRVKRVITTRPAGR